MYSSAGNSEIQILFHMINYGRCSPGLPKETGSMEGGIYIRDQRERERTITGFVYVSADGSRSRVVLWWWGCYCECVRVELVLSLKKEFSTESTYTSHPFLLEIPR